MQARNKGCHVNSSQASDYPLDRCTYSKVGLSFLPATFRSTASFASLSGVKVVNIAAAASVGPPISAAACRWLCSGACGNKAIVQDERVSGPTYAGDI